MNAASVCTSGLLATPRTDEVAVMVNGMARAYLCEETWKEAVNADFARELERDNARLRAALVLAIHVRGTSEDTAEVLCVMESALANTK